MDEYLRFEKLAELMQPWQTPTAKYCNAWAKMVQTGEFEPISDYGTGFLCLSWKVYPTVDREVYRVRVSVTSIDDGGWGARSEDLSLDKATSIVAQLTPVLGRIIILPKEEKLNQILTPYKLYGIYEG